MAATVAAKNRKVRQEALERSIKGSGSLAACG